MNVGHLKLDYTANINPYFKTAGRDCVVSDHKYEGDKASDWCTVTLTLAESVR